MGAKSTVFRNRTTTFTDVTRKGERSQPGKEWIRHSPGGPETKPESIQALMPDCLNRGALKRIIDAHLSGRKVPPAVLEMTLIKISLLLGEK